MRKKTIGTITGTIFGKIIAALMMPGVTVAYLIIFGRKKVVRESQRNYKSINRNPYRR